jgi:putative cell wall-binding protein
VSRKCKRLIACLITACFLFTQTFVAGPVFAQSADTDRISGADRYKTAVAISQKGWEKADYAVLARGDNFADALCAGPLAYKYGGPILLTEPGKLNADTKSD